MSINKLNAIAGAYNKANKNAVDKKAKAKQKAMDEEKLESPEFEKGEKEGQKELKKPMKAKK